MRVNVTVKGLLENYLIEQHKLTGLSYSMLMYNLATAGLQNAQVVTALGDLAKMMNDYKSTVTAQLPPAGGDGD